MDEKRAFLRHAVATVAYRGGKAVRSAPVSFAVFSGDGGIRAADWIITTLVTIAGVALVRIAFSSADRSPRAVPVALGA